MSESYWNTEDETFIKCPYCGEEYEPSYEDTWIGDKCVDCYTEDTQFVVCDECGKNFPLDHINLYGHIKQKQLTAK